MSRQIKRQDHLEPSAVAQPPALPSSTVSGGFHALQQIDSKSGPAHLRRGQHVCGILQHHIGGHLTKHNHRLSCLLIKKVKTKMPFIPQCPGPAQSAAAEMAHRITWYLASQQLYATIIEHDRPFPLCKTSCYTITALSSESYVH